MVVKNTDAHQLRSHRQVISPLSPRVPLHKKGDSTSISLGDRNGDKWVSVEASSDHHRGLITIVLSLPGTQHQGVE